MKVVSVVGARPQFIKAAVVSRELRKISTQILVHTGQHYDAGMSDIFFEELGIPAPDYNLAIGSGSHGAQTGAMLAAVEVVLTKEKPDWVLVYGDTNSTLAGALAAAKLHIPVAHVEAGLRSFNRKMPEEINRVVTDHISDLLFCPSSVASRNLTNEGLFRGVHVVGDVMYDALLWARFQQGTSSILDRLGLSLGHYVLATLHRAENTDDPQKLVAILQALNSMTEPVVFPIHPRTRHSISMVGWNPADHVYCIEPVGYLDMINLQSNARLIVTDSGGMQKEAYWLKVGCITLREETEWIETVESGWNILVGSNKEKILNALSSFKPANHQPLIYGESGAGRKIVSLLNQE
jgi:UDP-GlcNAc3NAcA epimerase